MTEESIECFLINVDYTTVVNTSKMSTFLTSHQLCSYIFIFMEAYKLLLCSLMEATFDMYEVEQWADCSIIVTLPCSWLAARAMIIPTAMNIICYKL